MSYANNDERTADLDEKFQDTHDVDANRADEQRGFSDSLFEFAKSTNNVYRTAYEAGPCIGLDGSGSAGVQGDEVSAETKSADIESLLARCMSIVMNPSANAADKRLAIDAAFDMGVAEGRVQGKQEMGEALTGVRVAVPS